MFFDHGLSAGFAAFGVISGSIDSAWYALSHLRIRIVESFAAIALLGAFLADDRMKRKQDAAA